MNPGPIDGGRRRRCRRVAVRSVASVAVLLVVGAGWASPANAHPDADDHGSISLSATGELGSPPSVSGTFFGASALGVFVEYMRSVSLTLTPTGPTGGGAVSADGCTMATAGKCGTGTVSFKWQLPGLAYNGPYVVNATADHCQVLCVSPGPAKVTPREFRLAADPAAPADVRADVGADRNVTVSWQRNPEPDIRFYQVSRKEGGGNFTRVGGDIRQPASGRPSFTDTSTSGTAGGEFAYRVVAVRNGASGDDSTTRTSRASGDKSVTVAPPPTTVAPGEPGAEIKPAGTDTNIGGYLAGQPGALPSPKPRFIDLPDTGFEGSLPFGQFPGEDMSEPGEGEEASPATLETRRLEAFNRGRPLIPIAAGAILLLLAAHLRLFNQRLKPDGHHRKSSAAEFIATLDASKHARIPLDVEAGVANGGHHRAPSGVALTQLPEWGQFRGVTLLPAAPASEIEDEDEDAGDEAWADSSDADADAEAERDAEADEERERDGWAVAEEEHELQAEVGADEEDDEDGFVAELEPWDVVVAAEPEAPGEGDVNDWDDEAERDAWGEDAVVDSESDDEPELIADLEDEEPAMVPALVPDEMVAEPEQEQEQDEESEIVAELVRTAGPVVLPEDDEDSEIVAELVPASGRVVIPDVEDLEDVTEPEPEPEVHDTETPEVAATTNGNGSHPSSDFDDFEWSEEAQYAEPEVEVFVAPKPATKKLASWAR